jgi:hydroxymethylglutaryl-CoA reductase (NADPH)
MKFMKVPALILRQLYTFGTLVNDRDGVSFGMKNRLQDATLTGVTGISVNGVAVPVEDIRLELHDGAWRKATGVSPDNAIAFALRESMRVHLKGMHLGEGKHEIGISFDSQPFGKLKFSVHDGIATEEEQRVKIPANHDDDYTPEMIAERQRFASQYAGKPLEHITKFSFDPDTTKGNIEHLTGVAQIPIGIAGPLRVRGEHAEGDFVVPLATTEGTLVASYNRGIKVLNLSGGVKCTVQDDCMQRAPVFVFESAREALEFRAWVDENLAHIREAAEATTSVGKLLYIDTYLASKFAYLRFNFSTGDAAGQNMVGRATFAACSWILEHVDTVKRFYLESNLATDKKASQVNIMRTRGKRVTAEAVVPREVLVQHMRVEPESIHYHAGVASVGSILSGANNNGCHSPNAVTAMFIATGQDVANVAESSAGIVYTELTDDGNLYISITLPSLIVATYGGGTGLATQRECLEMMGCYGRDRVRKLAEIIAGVCLAGELSLASAISSLDWVSSHERYGRNR